MQSLVFSTNVIFFCVKSDNLRYMKKNCRIINCARGGIIDENALLQAINEGKIAGAALDVFPVEPLPEDSPLRKCEKLLLTPHLGASTVEAQEKVALQVAEQIVTYFKKGEIINAVNAPSIDPELLKVMRPYLDLAEDLGKFASSYADSRVVKINCLFSGSILDYPLKPITTAIVKGFLEPLTDFAVNYISAMNLAKERGVEVVESKSTLEYQYTNLITIETEMENGQTNKICGTLYTKEMPRIVILNDRYFNAVPSGNMLVIKNKDVPGTIGTVCTILGNHNVNIADLTWGRNKPLGDAMTIINTDHEITADIVKEIDAHENILSAKFIKV